MNRKMPISVTPTLGVPSLEKLNVSIFSEDLYVYVPQLRRVASHRALQEEFNSCRLVNVPGLFAKSASPK